MNLHAWKEHPGMQRLAEAVETHRRRQTWMRTNNRELKDDAEADPAPVKSRQSYSA
jgi:hypothetical protein